MRGTLIPVRCKRLLCGGVGLYQAPLKQEDCARGRDDLWGYSTAFASTHPRTVVPTFPAHDFADHSWDSLLTFSGGPIHAKERRRAKSAAPQLLAIAFPVRHRTTQGIDLEPA